MRPLRRLGDVNCFLQCETCSSVLIQEVGLVIGKEKKERKNRVSRSSADLQQGDNVRVLFFFSRLRDELIFVAIVDARYVFTQ